MRTGAILRSIFGRELGASILLLLLLLCSFFAAGLGSEEAEQGRLLGGSTTISIPASSASEEPPWSPSPSSPSSPPEPRASAEPSSGDPQPQGTPSPPWHPTRDPQHPTTSARPLAASSEPSWPPPETPEPSIPTTGLPRTPSASPKEEEEEEEEEDLGGHSGTDIFCNCSSIGSKDPSGCNATTGQCECHQGYTGQLCDRCEERYYLEQSGGHCLACGCHPGGSVSSTCLNSGRCQCKAGATGPKCAECQEGYSKFNGTTCEPCHCNNHSSKCDPWTGACLDCQGNTEGARCEKCKGQFYRNNNSQLHECLLCPCSTVTSTGSCQIQSGCHAPTCDKCRPGYTGPLCNQCADGYYSSDSICVRCHCNGNVDPVRTPRVCQLETGECLECLYHTAGPHCEKCQEGYTKHSEGGNCTRIEYVPGPAVRGFVPSAPNVSPPTPLPTTAANATLAQTTPATVSPISSSDNSTSALADVSWTQFNIIILTVIIILVVLLMGFVGAVYTYREYQNRKLNAPFWTIELKEDNISFSSYHDSIPNADVSGLLEDDGNEVAPNGQLTLATPMHNYKA
ncbi:multiple epidermal growth factor-like domains protein 9 [Sceloporus undulatus]|uniref:multiple epidermal growth factor-like domains protein 9 n=1 Tax=Sceloporus undulatus TaxID=8520 RepID=UPI001C4C1CAB|nr:multiple epidermal growth factor-like domains protein 9 [Sceloporus undulatus]